MNNDLNAIKLMVYEVDFSQSLMIGVMGACKKHARFFVIFKSIISILFDL